MAARHRSSRRVVLRERNERGFALFLRNLKSVLNLLANIEEQELETDILIETRCRLVDASGTLSFLMSDIESGVTNATGLPSSALRDPRRRKEFGLSDSVSAYSDISDDELDEIYKSITGSSTTGLLNTPNIGYTKEQRLERSEMENHAFNASENDGSAHSWTQREFLGAGAFGKEVKAIKNEIDILSNFKHKRIVSCYGSEQKDGGLYLFMEFMAGGSLSDHIKRNKTLSESESGKYTMQILEGVSFLHSENIIHRDIKGSNVLLDDDGNVKLADFGLSKIIQKIGSKTNLMSCCGTLYWMAPEIFRGEGYGRKADIWSVGCTVVEMLTGSPPLGDLEPEAAIFKIGSRPTEPKLPESVSQDAKEFIQAALTWLVL
ncbi:Mitogen-activated protein kinase kinase kinase 2 [Desmophyllum pertusum]|uniref:Mitogen-activated protein kinase kinase kinase 2 n=1 Tax=Desmophyllum pertusum TaxID=174260 RepID=A0A9W9ZNB5_9CNID|nr:Mitogen-activated protein kinase kinase kinase 2 [Desmophyllum pertusum]